VSPLAQPPGRQRLFFALAPDAQGREALWHAASAGVAAYGGRSIPAENLHVTLAFLGDVTNDRLPLLAELAAAAAARFTGTAELNLQITRLQYWARPQILCALAEQDVADAPRVFALAQALRLATAAAGFAPDLKPFHAHVTVARKVTHALDDKKLAPVTWSCAEFALLASRTTAEGSVYSVVESHPLVKPENARK
jgi:RNA 2',3'-cyclic 3'-phosphodiesterase